MFDIGFSELLLFGVIALIVLGPEKLPKAARTAGQWYAKIRRTVSTLQSEIEAEFNLAETRQQMQDEIAKIRQTEAEMKREMAEMRGSMREFEYSKNQGIRTQDELNRKNQANKDAQQPSTDAQAPTTAFSYAYESEHSYPLNQSSTGFIKPLDQENSEQNTDSPVIQPVITRPWENMWFRLGAYDKARRLPAAPYLPNYRADPLLNAASNTQGAAE